MSIIKYVLAGMIYLSASLAATAAPVTYDFTADNTNSDGALNADLVGSTVAGSFNYDSSAPFGTTASNTALTNFMFDIQTTSGLVSFSIIDGMMGFTPTQWSVGSASATSGALPISGATLFSANFNIFTPIATPLVALPTDLSVFSSGTMNMSFLLGNSVGQGFYSVTGITARTTTPPTNTVPEPGALGLLGLGLVGLGLVRRRRA